WEQVVTFFRVVGEMLNPSTADFIAIFRLEGALEMALTMAALAGLSEAVGHSVVLFINRVRFRRFMLSLLISAAVFVVTYLFFALSIYAVVRLGFANEADFRAIAIVVGLSYAPRLLGFVSFVPYFGLPLAALLNVWSVLVMMESVSWALESSPVQALVSILLGGLLLLTMQRSIGRPVMTATRWAMGRAAGVPLVTDRKGLYALLDDRPESGMRSPFLKSRYRPPSVRFRQRSPR
ncbi:MAG TPA: hypothetical protein VKZ43_04640, partial [Trueperaceae bacterium]|nr:hypothetical protein [Trueperaceae bacterium]